MGAPSTRTSSRAASPKSMDRAIGRGRPKHQEENIDRRDVILDAGEALFGDHGFHAVTVREVAKEAGVDPALLMYYFGSKRGLFDAVFLRRAEVANADRLVSMAQYASTVDRKTVTGCLNAFLEPVLHRWETGGVGWRNYFRLVALVNNTPAWGGDTMARYFDPVVHKLIAQLREILPLASEADLFWCYHFISGALALSFAETGRIDTLSDGLCHSGDVTAVRRRMARFMAGGVIELCGRGLVD